jgi:hypothetical protein
MSIVHIDIHTVTHTCAASWEPHPIDTRRTIVLVVDGGPCRQPVTIRSGNTTTTVIACGRHLPRDRQCPACRITIIGRRYTTTHLGHHGRKHPTCGVAA